MFGIVWDKIPHAPPINCSCYAIGETEMLYGTPSGLISNNHGVVIPNNISAVTYNKVCHYKENGYMAADT